MNKVVVKQGSGNIVSGDFLSKLNSGIAESRATTVLPGGKPFLRMKNGDWMYGAENVDVEEGSTWQVNVFSLCHGWCCWTNYAKEEKKKNELLGEVMASMADGKPHRPAEIDGWEFNEQRSFDLKCTSGEDAGTEVHYKTSSVGGMRAVDELLVAIQGQLAVDPAHPCPVLRLNTDHYDHNTYGRTYVPVFEIVGWATMDGGVGPELAIAADPAPEPEPEPEPAPAPRKRQRRAIAEPVQEPEPAPSPAPTTAVHAAQRRRPGR